MKNKLLFMMLTMLGAPGFAAATGYDMAGSEYNLAVNELSAAAYNKAAIIGQSGANNNEQTSQAGSKLLSVISQNGGNNLGKIDQRGGYNVAYIGQSSMATGAANIQRA